MFSKVNSFGLHGVEGFPVEVEADISDGLPAFIMVGYLSEEVREAQERIRTSFRNSGFRPPPRRITVNLSPAGVRKGGTAYDLAIAASVLICMGEAPFEPGYLKKCVFIGELGLDGMIKAVSGVLPRVYSAVRAGMERIYLPEENVEEGAAVEGAKIVGVRDLNNLADYLRHPETAGKRKSVTPPFAGRPEEEFEDDFEELAGLPTVRRASEAAAAGKHNILYIGPAGTGKTMAARCLPSVMPPLTMEESLEVSKLYSICGLLGSGAPLLQKRPFRSPHHGTTARAMTGGGSEPRPGEISLASEGILFLDELAEFQPQVLDLLRQPMEEGIITITRMNKTVTFPANAIIAAAMNPCKCGFYPDLGRCRCTPQQRQRYLSRVSGPFLDRIDIGVEVPRQDMGAWMGKKGESSASMRKRVVEARHRQRERFRDETISVNGEMGRKQIEKYCCLSASDRQFLDRIGRKMGLSARGYGKLLKVARTLADLDGKEKITAVQLAEAAAFRSFETKYWM